MFFNNLSNNFKNQVYNSLILLLSKNDLEKLSSPFKRNRIFEPYILIWAFCIQSLREKFSCSDAVSFVMGLRMDAGLPMGSFNTAAYCKARAKLDIATLQDVSRATGKNISDRYEQFCWKNRRIKIIDGTTLKMADSKENKKQYPKHYGSKKGLGEPLIKMLGVFCFATGVFLDQEFGKYTHTGSLFK